MTIGLTMRQQEVLEFIRDEMTEHSRPPTFREVAARFGIKSTNGVKVHMDALEKKGYITRDSHLARGIELTPLSGEEKRPVQNVRYLPVVGRVAAGAPVLAEENLDGYLAVDSSFIQADGVFALTVSGDSMKDAGIFNGDYVLGKPVSQYFPGDIVVAIIGDEATVKRYYPEDDRIRLEPENPAYGPIIVETDLSSFRVAGKVIGVMRRM